MAYSSAPSLRLAALALLPALLPACGDDSAGTATLGDTSTTTGTGTTAPATTEATSTGTPTTSDSDSGTGSASETTTGDLTTGTTTTTTTTDTTTTGTTDDTTTTTTTGTTTGSSSTSTGPDAECGNGLLEDGEACDDGPGNGPNQSCLDGCVLNICGDGDQGPLEACDDGNLAGGDGCDSKCVQEVCGDGVVQAGLGEQCDDGNVIDGDGCSSTCAKEPCGNGVLDPGEQCDDGNMIDGDGCDATCQLEQLSSCAPGTVSVLTNEGFEAGVFPPWTSNSNATKVVMTNPHAGQWAAETLGNFYVQQDFAAVPVPQLTMARFWSWHDGSDAPAMEVRWGYSDNTNGFTVYGGVELDGWREHDLLAMLDANKSLVWLRAWGYSGGGNAEDFARFDDFRLCKKP